MPATPWVAATFSAVHVLAIGIGLGGIVLRARAATRRDLPTVLIADAAWGVAAALWLITGLVRAFGGLEKGSDYYLHNTAFWIKIGLFVSVWLLELIPMITLIRWRMGRGTVGDPATLDRIAQISWIETAIVVAIPFVAAAMARGVGM